MKTSTGANAPAEGGPKFMIPENCKLIAVHTGDGWLLEVSDNNGNTIAILAWPEAWPESMTSEELEKCGFEIA